jgi:hypothetical protein
MWIVSVRLRGGVHASAKRKPSTASSDCALNQSMISLPVAFHTPARAADVAEHLVEMTDAPRLAHDPRMQVQHHQPSGGRAVGIETVEPLAPQQVDLVDRAPAVQVDVVVVEVLLLTPSE